MAVIDTRLLEGEEILHRASSHWIKLLNPLVRAAIGLAIFVNFFRIIDATEPEIIKLFKDWIRLDVQYVHETLFWLVSFGVFWMTSTALKRFLAHFTKEFAVTTLRTLNKSGIIGIDLSSTYHHKVESMQCYETVFGRLLGYGEVTVYGSAADREYIPHLKDARTFVDILETQILKISPGLAAKGQG